jgi:crotonobetainyl-CoA:carnitine CoA-transferase CaiB-like acyl-CoA transferase
MAGSPIKSSLTPVSFRCPPPILGQDTEKTLSHLGYSREEIDSFKTEGDI